MNNNNKPIMMKSSRQKWFVDKWAGSEQGGEINWPYDKWTEISQN